METRTFRSRNPGAVCPDYALDVQPTGDPLAIIAARLDRVGVPPDAVPLEVLQGAWDQSRDVEAMMKVLNVAARLKLVHLDSIRWVDDKCAFATDAGGRGWERVSFERATGCEELRRTIPRLPDAWRWAEALAEQRERLDPIAVLVADLNGPAAEPGADWRARWSREPVEPLAAAWAASADGFAMLALLRLAARPDLEECACRAASHIGMPSGCRGPWAVGPPLPQVAAKLAVAIRSTVPEPFSLSEAYERRRKRVEQ
jgi:hypothetical protein